MEKAFYTISLYVDEDENLIGIPCGESDKYGIADIDKVHLERLFDAVGTVDVLVNNAVQRGTAGAVY